MKLSVASASAIVALLAVAQAAPAPAPYYSTETGLSKRDIAKVNNAVAQLNSHALKRSEMTPEELAKRESQIVTDVLSAINSTGLAPKIIQYIIDDPQLSQIATDVIVAVVKSGVVDLDTLLKGLNDSGLAVSVIQDLINNCEFYAEIYKIVLSELANLPNLIGQILGGKNPFSKREMEAFYEYQQITKRTLAFQEENAFKVEKRATSTGSAPAATSGSSDSTEQQIVTSLMESLKNSGLANSVVNTLVTDDKFYTWGASLIESLFKNNAITIPELISALADSGLIPTIIKNFLNWGTFKTVIVNALAAALGKCDSQSLTTLKPSTTLTSSTFTLPPTTSAGTQTSIPTKVCKKRKRRSY